ncbi:MAG: penicillin-binding protein 2 [Oscillospiraceae bacterium]
MNKRLLSLFIMFIAGFTILQARLFMLMTDNLTEEASSSQSIYKTTVAQSRPDFFDCNGTRITGAGITDYAVLFPGDKSSYNVMSYLDSGGIDSFLKGMGGNTPFLLPLLEPMPADSFIDTVKVRDRYAENQTAAHLIGYLDYDNKGVSGLESAFEEYFSKNIINTIMEVEVNAQQIPLDGVKPRIYNSGIGGAGVELTIDLRIQKVCEQIADKMMKSGAIVVVDSNNGEIKAMVSRPNFDPADIAGAIESGNSALVNRAMTAYNVGSIYKPIIAACALGAGIDSEFGFECTGSVEIDGQSYSCNNGTAHGQMNVETALINSCNTYFIALGQRLGSEAVFNVASAIGAGRRITLYDGFSTSCANMPTVSELNKYGELCNHCFGQGKLLLTPLHVAAATNSIANKGNYIDLTLVKKVGDSVCKAGANREVFESESASSVAAFMEKVVSEGTGKNAEPENTTAAGKTGTAQTGSYNSDGTERVIGWFTGWFPAESPKYTVVVMTEDEGYGFESAAPIFAQIADELTLRVY